MTPLDFLEVAEAIAAKSKNPKRKIGAVILSPALAIVATGWNGVARGVSDTAPRYAQPLKEYYMVHAEANAIYNAARAGAKTAGCIMLVTGLMPCAQCANAIVQAGITTVYYPETRRLEQKWSENFAHSLIILTEAGVCIETYMDS